MYAYFYTKPLKDADISLSVMLWSYTLTQF